MTDGEVEKIIRSNMNLQMNLAGIRGDFEAKLQRTWVGLTDEEIDKAWRSCDYTVPWEQHRIDIARAIEAKLKAKNGFYSTEKNT